MEFSAIAKIIVVFLGVLSSSRLRLPLGAGLIGGGIILELWAGLSVSAIIHDLARALQRTELWLLLLNITLILEFGHFMAVKKNSAVLIAAARRYGGQHGQAVSLILIPAAIGLIPMPGGALFSAPLIGRTAAPDLSPAWKAAVNYWFRHVLEFWWPLYPVVIVTLSIFTIETWQFMIVQLPFMVVSVSAGYFFLLRGRLSLLDEKIPNQRGTKRELAKVLLPIFLIVACTLVLPGIYRQWLPTASSTSRTLLAMLSGLLGGLLYIGCNQHRENDKTLFKQIFTVKTANVLITLTGVMIFQDLLTASGLVPKAAAELTDSQVPVPVIIAFLPFLAGLVTGIAIGFAGTAFPLVLGFMEAGQPELSPLATLVLAFSMGYAGMMLSPVHLCFVLTKEYFTAPFVTIYRHILPCVMAVMATGTLFHLLLQLLSY